MLGVFLSYFLLFITLVLTLVQVADALASKHQPEPEQIITLTLPVLTEEGAIQVDGNLDWELFGAFKQTLKDHPEIQNVQLNSTGGFVFVARAMALQIQQRKLNTHIDTHCYSACAVAFLAGESRTMAQNAELGFHQYQMESGDAQGLINVTDELERDRRFFAERGMSEAFLNRVFNAAHTEIWIPTREELIESGVLLP